MLSKIIEWDKELFLFLNGKHTAWLDPVMAFAGSTTCWVSGALLMLAVIYFTTGGRKKVTALFFALTVGLSALLTNIIKVIVERPRPIHNTLWKDAIHALEGTTDATYSFFSSHSATTFSMAVFFLLATCRVGLSRLYGYAAIAWAATVAYSRIYVAKHYPLDVLCGILFGILMGIMGYRLLEKIEKVENEKCP